ncbi:glycosyltransferase family 2 protein [Priestia megaterium]|uniref:glycosyltransferase family 2 protein n=1 Tax=Priestia megaterium TaxID=1404 RepID=UPI000BF908D0|nr:sugar transferase [Priestia megaterium]PFD99356.1 sugar transferase [Priestia megaterium]
MYEKDFKIAVILFVYNRPEHTERVLEGLRKNNIDKLYIFSDGLKKEEHYEGFKKVRTIINDIDWCKCTLHLHENNLGLAKSVIFGVTKVLEENDAVIVLEDDCVPTQKFYYYMRECLTKYKDEKKVMHVTGGAIPLSNKNDEDIYFYPYPGSWGWGTWKDRWVKFEDNTEEYRKLLNNRQARKNFGKPGSIFVEFLDKQLKGEVDSWLIRWYYTIYKNQGLCIWPFNSYIENIGFDGSGVHKVKSNKFEVKPNYKSNEQIIFPTNYKVDRKIISEFRMLFHDSSFPEKLKSKIKKLKRKVYGS